MHYWKPFSFACLLEKGLSITICFMNSPYAKIKDHRAAAALPYQSSLIGLALWACPSLFGSLRFDLALPRSPSEPPFLRKVSYENDL
jgi:hypothetical protein